MKTLLATLTLTFAMASAFAAETFTVETVEVKNFSSNLKGFVDAGTGSGAGTTGVDPTTQAPTTPAKPTFGDKVDNAGKVIAVAKDLVALGEDIYKLVQKGKPTNTTDFAPIAIVPRDPVSKEVVSPFDMENCSMPATKKYVTTIKNSNGGEAVRFEYMVVFTYGCSYNGNGKFIQSAMVQPVSVKTTYGWDFSASMKLGSILNYGSKNQPVAGAMITLKYSMNSWHTAFERNDTIHMTAKGDIQNLSQN
jgi:hypothetical protein